MCLYVCVCVYVRACVRVNVRARVLLRCTSEIKRVCVHARAFICVWRMRVCAYGRRVCVCACVLCLRMGVHVRLHAHMCCVCAYDVLVCVRTRVWRARVPALQACCASKSLATLRKSSDSGLHSRSTPSRAWSVPRTLPFFPARLLQRLRKSADDDGCDAPTLSLLLWF